MSNKVVLHPHLFFRLLDMAIWNVFYIYKKHCDTKARLVKFREVIIKSYLGITTLNCSDLVSGRKRNDNRLHTPAARSEPETNRSNFEEMRQTHWPELIPKAPDNNRNKAFLKCRLCTRNKTRKETSYRCKGCPDKVPFCPACFEQYHVQLEN